MLTDGASAVWTGAKALPRLVTELPAVVNDVKSAVKAMVPAVKALVPKLPGLIKTTVTGVADNAASIVKNPGAFLSDLKTGLSNPITTKGGIFGTPASTTSTAVSETVTPKPMLQIEAPPARLQIEAPPTRLQIEAPPAVQTVGDGAVSEAANTGSRLGEMSDSAFSAADNVGGWTVSAKHLPNAGGNYNKWAPGVDINGSVAGALRSEGATFWPNPGGTADSFIVRTEMDTAVGTKGQTVVKVVVSNDGRVITSYPGNWP
jgi:hypothetical protein